MKPFRRPGPDAPAETGRTPPAGARRAAQAALNAWAGRGVLAAELIEAEADSGSLSAADRAFLQHLVLGVLRNVSLLDHWIGELTGGRTLDKATQWLLRAGLCEMMLLDVAAHAAVNENVALAGRAAGLVNAVLRRACRERQSMLEEMSRLPLHVRCSHPPFLVERWRRQFGNSDTEQLLRWNQEPAPVYARLNRLHPGAEQGMAELSAAQPEVDDFFLCKSAPIEPLRQGWCYVQDPSTMLAPRMLAAEPGMTVLDACAAPGGKSAVIAQSMRNEGRLVACDLPGGRLRRLEENLRRLRVTCAEILAVDWLASTGEIFPPETFDGILLDAPCSNTGVMRRRVDVRWRISENEFARMTALQRRFLECCVPLLKPGGRLVYSTCSIDREENESQVEWLQQTFPGLKCARMQTLLPQRDGVDGAFAALLIKDR